MRDIGVCVVEMHSSPNLPS